MTQPRIFVSYMPERAMSARPVRRAPEPMVAVLAGALLAGGGMHSGSRGESGDVRPAVSPQAPTVRDRIAPAPSPYLAVASIAPVEKRALPRSQPTAPRPAAKRSAPPPVTSPRRDLAGFLEDRGLALADPGPDAALAEPVTAIRDDAGFASAVPSAASTPLSAAGLAEPMPAIADTVQTFPVVSIAGRELGAVTMRGDKVHLASLVGLLELKLPAAEFERLRDAPAADSFITVESLRAAGIDVAVDPAGERITLAAT